MPGQLKNVNRQTHGKFGFLANGRMPKGGSYIRRQLSEFKAAMEQAVVAVHGQVGLLHAATIATALKHEGRSQLCSRWLRLEPGLSLADRLALLREVGSAADARDRCIRLLGIESPADNSLNSLMVIHTQVQALPPRQVAIDSQSAAIDAPASEPGAAEMELSRVES